MSANKLSVEQVAVVAHKNQPGFPQDHLVKYLADRGISELVYIEHSFSDRPDRISRLTRLQAGEVVERRQSADWCRFPEPVVYLKEWWLTRQWLRQLGVRWDLVVAMDGLCTNFVFSVPRKFRERIAFWNLDFVPEGRFGSRFKNWFYSRINMRAAMNADEMWDHTARMVEQKEKILGLSPADYKAHRVVPQGVWMDEMVRYRYEDCDRHTAVFLGQLTPKQGLQFVIPAIPRIVESIPDFRLKVIGGGLYRNELEALVSCAGVGDHVEFTGRIESNEEMQKQVARCSIGIAPFAHEADTFTKFGSDPGKLKVYLGSGLPVLTTDVPWSATEIERRECGQIISESTDDIAANIIRFLSDPNLNQRHRDNAIAYAREFDYKSIFSQLFGRG